jgi:hypothetical protein
MVAAVCPEGSWLTQLTSSACAPYLAGMRDVRLGTVRRVLLHVQVRLMLRLWRSFCSDYFPSDKGFIIDTSSGRLNAPTPPVTKFNCVRSEFEQRLDHFDNTEVRTFSQVYWVSLSG